MQVHRRANSFSTSQMSQPRSGRMSSTISQVHSFHGNLAHEGKMEEIRWVKEIGPYKKISRAEKKRRGITVLVGRELRSWTKGVFLAHEIFSAMPPWEIFKVLLGLLVSDNPSGRRR